MKRWQKLLAQSLASPEKLAKKFGLKPGSLDRVVTRYPARLNPYLLGLIQKPGDPIWRQFLPDPLELRDGLGQADPLREAVYSPVKGLVHRYPDRALLYVSNICAGYCRFCTRKRKVGFEYVTLREKDLQRALRYIREHKKIRDVIISGGDPLMLEDKAIERYLKALSLIDHVEMVRIDSRAPASLPQRVTPELCRLLAKYDPLYLLTHFNHPREITPEARAACARLADSGVVLGNQAVLLKGVNDNADTLRRLGEALLRIRVRPYYLYIPDAVSGTDHFRVPIRRALKIMRRLIGHTSGLAVPKLIIDLEGGGGKLPLTPRYVVRKKGKEYIFRNFEDKLFKYHDV